jgi:hydrogenase maturation protease
MLVMMMSKSMKEKKITIIGIGNTLYQDEGVGVHIIPYLEKLFKQDTMIEIIEGSTDGMKLLGPVEDSSHLIVIDAINAGKEGGTIITLIDDEIPAYYGVKMSIHQLGFQEVLFASKLRERYPEHIVMFGMQPTSLDFGIGLSTVNAEKLPQLVDLITTQVKQWRDAS